MQVRKFEAKTMKEALEMVKTQLGPDAIILSAKDNSRGFGLAGQKSVEITAAVSEDTLQKKRYAESKLRKEDLARIQKAPARIQKEFIEKSVNKYMKENTPRPAITQRQYIDIDDEVAEPIESDNSFGEQFNQFAQATETAGERIKTAAQRAWNAMQATGTWVEPSIPAQVSKQTVVPVAQAAPSAEIISLRQELAQLKTVLSGFQNVPQQMSGQHPGAEYGLTYDFSPIFEKLQQSGVATDVAAEILSAAQKEMPPIKYKNKALIEGWVAKYMLDTTKIVEDMTGTQIQVFVGPSGSGKTSALVKLASHYVVNARKKVALVTTDTQKVGAIDQLRIYAQILNVPFAIVRTANDWPYILQHLRGYDYILCDCHGTSMKTIEEIQSLKAIIPKYEEHTTTHLVLNATSKDQDMAEMGRRYKSVNFKDVIFTSVDDSTQHGAIYNFIRRFDVPLHSFGIGPRVPEDFEMATRERLLDLIFKLTKVKKVAEL